MSRIILVSNRVGSFGAAKEAGGVSVALRDTLRFHGGDWFGWNGRIEDTPAPAAELEADYDGNRVFTLSLSPEEHHEYYLGYANSVLWPVLHNRLDLAQFEAGYYEGYVNVNRRLAQSVAARVESDDIIWVHDFHLVPLAKELRALGLENPIGFFLHVPVAPAQTMLALPEHQQIANDLSHYDLIGLQTQSDVRNLIDFFECSVWGRVLTAGTIKVCERVVEVARFPVGIDVGSFLASSAEVETAPMAQLRIVGIDRLDYTKGLPQKFRAFDRFLKEHPEYHGRVLLSQLAPPTRESVEAYADIRAELEALAGAVNGRYSQLDWVPINYIHRPLARSELVSLYRSSRVGWVTPLRDGMNLVSKEYVAAQDPADPGVLILSRFAGAADQLTEAVLVNPFDPAEMRLALYRALEMPLAERRERHAAMLEVVRQSDSQWWSESFIASLRRAGARKRGEELTVSPPIAEVLARLDGKRATAGGSSVSPAL